MLVIFHSIKYIYICIQLIIYLFIYLFISNSNSDLTVHLNSEQ